MQKLSFCSSYGLHPSTDTLTTPGQGHTRLTLGTTVTSAHRAEMLLSDAMMTEPSCLPGFLYSITWIMIALKGSEGF